jgi:hypothetical protein
MAVASAAPDNIRGHAVVPFGDFADDTLALLGLREVCTDIVESLLADIGGRTLAQMSTQCLHYGRRVVSTYPDGFHALLKLLKSPSDDDNIGSLLRELASNSFAHTL